MFKKTHLFPKQACQNVYISLEDKWADMEMKLSRKLLVWVKNKTENANTVLGRFINVSHTGNSGKTFLPLPAVSPVKAFGKVKTQNFPES